MYSFTKEDFDILKEKYLYQITNNPWNCSMINHPNNVGYLMSHIDKLKPKTYEDWEEYFYKNIADQNKLMRYAERFRDFVFDDAFAMSKYNYHYLHIKVFYKMVVCRLIYETWLGYSAEVEIRNVIVQKLKSDGFNVKIDKPNPKDDNKYGVDFFLHFENKLICGIHVKPEKYRKSSQKIVHDTIKTNEMKNKLFTSIYGVPVKYAFYKRIDSTKCILIDDAVIKNIESLLLK